MRGSPSSLCETAFREQDHKARRAYVPRAYTPQMQNRPRSAPPYREVFLNSGEGFSKKGWPKLAHTTAKFGTDSVLPMSYKLLNDFSTSSIQRLVSKVTETEIDEDNWEAQRCPPGPGEKPLGLRGPRKLNSPLLTLCMTKGENILLLVRSV